MSSASQAVSVHITAPDVARASAWARVLVEERLAACANIVPGIRSVYRWDGAVHESAEVLVLVKTTRPRVDALLARIAALHSDEVPCALVLPIETGLPAYLAWLDESTRD